MKTISIKGIEFKQFQNTNYYCDIYGNVYSDYSQKILNPMTRINGTKKYKYIDINFKDGNGQRHYPIHRMMYETWIGEIPKGYNICHKNDNSLDNNINNLYAGTQKENINDCFNNDHRVGNCWILTVYDYNINQTITFCPASNFIEYSGHTCENGNIHRMFSRNWFKKRYKIIDYYLCKSLDIKKGVTTMGDECSPVE